MKYTVTIWGYVFPHIEALSNDMAKTVAISMYNENLPDGIKVDKIIDREHIVCECETEV